MTNLFLEVIYSKVYVVLFQKQMTGAGRNCDQLWSEKGVIVFSNSHAGTKLGGILFLWHERCNMYA